MAKSKNNNSINTLKPTAGDTSYHTGEFLKRRDEFKKIYKDMNNGIREFFNAMHKHEFDIDQVLDAMDYVEDGDRRYKKEFINSLMKVH